MGVYRELKADLEKQLDRLAGLPEVQGPQLTRRCGMSSRIGGARKLTSWRSYWRTPTKSSPDGSKR